MQVEPAQRKEREARGKKAPPYLADGLILLPWLKIERMIGGGGFGQVFRALDLRKNKLLAVKVEPSDRDCGRMILEQKVLTLLRGTKHTPKVIASGHYDKYIFIAMEMLGRNLNDLRHRMPTRRFSTGTGLRVCAQLLVAVRDIHTVGFLHRDIKPSNFCIGYAPEEMRRNVYLVDFGMTRRYRFEDGQLRKCRTYAGFRGTIRYVSVNVHERRDQGPVDDLWSLLYSLIELCEGALAWRNIELDDDMAQKKRQTQIEAMLMDLPHSIKDIEVYLKTLTYDKTPDYEYIRSIMLKALPKGITDSSSYDWENIKVSSKSWEMESIEL